MMRPRSLRCAGLVLVLATVLIAGCAPTVQVHGYVPSPTDIAQVTPGSDTFASVEEKLGRPSSSGLLRDSSWYYVQTTVENFTYNPPRVIDRTILAVEFSNNGVVQDITRYGLEDGRIVALSPRTTETGGRTMGVLEQLFGNLLNLDAEQFNQ
jgi:outer membrane protein assembly factor BamE (lipoprotein component of BamABCDE complex)